MGCKAFLSSSRPKFFERGESFRINVANINVIHCNLITQMASIDILLLHGSNLYWLLNARYLLFYATCKLLLSVSNLKQICEIS